jgi:hypothetical protein
VSTGPGDDEEPRPAGHVRSTGAGAITGAALVGLVLGWSLRPVSVQLNGTAPTVGWLPVLALAFVALIVGSVAWSTHRALHRRRERLEPHHAVNRLVLAKSCALAGALVAGGYLGYALSWWGVSDAELAHQRMVRALVGGLAGIALVVGSLLLERACRVSRDES